VKVSFPNVPEACAIGEDEADALSRARFILEECLAVYYVMQGRTIPEPSPTNGAPLVGTDKFTLDAPESAISGGRY
jgi:predicted RNase H-like HicB family nuclease